MTQEQIERELSKLYLELNQRPLKDGQEIMDKINKLQQQLQISNLSKFGGLRNV